MNDEPFRPDIEAVFEHYGARVLSGSGRWQKATCPLLIHEDMSPSASVNVDTGKWQCFSCDKHGDVYDILKENENLAGFPQLVEFAEANFERGDRPVRQDRVSGGRRPGRSGGNRGNGAFVPPWGRV